MNEIMPTRARKARLTPWSQAGIDEEKRRVKEWLDAIEREKGAEARFAAALKEIRSLQDSEAPAQRLRCFVLIVSAVLHAARIGGLTRAQVSRLVDLGEAILATQGIRSVSSLLSFLYGELYLAVSIWHRNAGEHWRSAWEHQVSRHLSQRSPPGGEGFQLLSRGLRALRLGHLKLAVSLL